jgi:hypothetical protein
LLEQSISKLVVTERRMVGAKLDVFSIGRKIGSEGRPKTQKSTAKLTAKKT